MRKVLAAGTAGVLLAFGLAITGAPASAEATGPIPVVSDCNQDWYVNHDEGDRLPEQVEGGLEFKGSDLVHHAVTGLTVETLTKGTFKASKTPDQDSFFSVEVMDEDGTGYATLRWNTATSEWNMVVKGSLYKDADPAKLVAAVDPSKSKRVISFGVGYTANPPGTVPTVISEITFADTTYDLTCPAQPAAENVSDEKWECDTGYSTRGGTVEYAWDAAKHEWVKKAAVWGDWVKQRDLTEEESAKLECTPPVTEVELVAPEAKRTCDGLWYTAPEANEQYVDKYEVSNVKPGGFTVTAILKPGFKLKADAKGSWDLTYTEPTNCPTPTPNPPTDPAPTTGNPGSGGGSAPTVTPSNASGDLPLTGSSKGTLIGMFGVGGLMVAVGGIILVLLRRRRDAEPVESA